MRDSTKVTPLLTAAVTTLLSDHSAVTPPTLCAGPSLVHGATAFPRPSTEPIPGPHRLHPAPPVTHRRRAAPRANERVPPRRRQPIETRAVGVARRRPLRPLRTMRERTAHSGASPAPFLLRGRQPPGALPAADMAEEAAGRGAPISPGGGRAAVQAGADGIRRWKRKRLLRRERPTVSEQCGCALGTGPGPANGRWEGGDEGGAAALRAGRPEAGLEGARSCEIVCFLSSSCLSPSSLCVNSS